MQAILFIGIPATGKSTFYQQRFFSTHVRINLDMLKTRRREDIFLEACLRARQPFVVDNTNVSVAERAKYIRLARAAGFRVTGYVFDSDLAAAIERNQARSGKALIPEKGVRARYHQLELPRLDEGFDALYTVSINPTGGFIVEEWHDQRHEFQRS
jgi:predicted kinase